MRVVLVGALLCTLPSACGGDAVDADAAQRAKANRFNATGAYGSVKRQVEFGLKFCEKEGLGRVD